MNMASAPIFFGSQNLITCRATVGSRQPDHMSQGQPDHMSQTHWITCGSDHMSQPESDHMSQPVR